ncbi:hypothetical protein [Metapseudomonas boanensis]|uniref:Xanthine/uracil/vitamin C permease n=1 Tax=Metapseudomonas boanensis TaxID=2822138 RepID=A0ABS5XFE2_9GAMM|nr:hypothetical protein [Pseudomonas boanensis]MBT8766380.1 hypothetical protein [Pseudomonas boanensis]
MSASDLSVDRPDLIYGLNDTAGFRASTFAAIQLVLASFVGITTPTLIVGSMLGLQSDIPFLISMALPVSVFGAFVQVRRFGPVGSGLLYMQGTIISLVVLLLLKMSMTDMAGGFGAADLGSLSNLGLAGLVLGAIVIFYRFDNPLLRLSPIIMGLGLGLGLAGVPEVLHELPKALQSIFESPMAVGAFSAILLSFILPDEHVEIEENEFEPRASMIEALQNPQDEAEQRNAEDSPSGIGHQISRGYSG